MESNTRQGTEDAGNSIIKTNLNYYNALYRKQNQALLLLHALISFDQQSKARPIRQILGPILNSLTKNGLEARMLDYGCGWGALFLLLPRRPLRLCYYDISLEAMNNVGKLMELTGRNSEAVKVDHCGNLQAAPFDVIVCSHVLEHVPDDYGLLKSLCAALKPNGYLLLNVPINEVWVDPKHIRKYDPILLKKFIAESGFRVVLEQQADRWTDLLLTHEVRLGFSWGVKIIFKALRAALAITPYKVCLLGERLFCSRYSPQQYIVVARKV